MFIFDLTFYQIDVPIQYTYHTFTANGIKGKSMATSLGRKTRIKERIIVYLPVKRKRLKVDATLYNMNV